MEINHEIEKEDLWFKQINASISRDYKIKPSSPTPLPLENRTTIAEKIAKDTLNLAARHTKEFIATIFDDSRFQMEGLAIVATYLKRKKGLDGLFVCKSLEAFQAKLQEINRLKGNIRLGLVVPSLPEYSLEEKEYQGNTSHKIAVCVEKIGTQIQIAILDSCTPYIPVISPKVILSPPKEVMYNLAEENAILWYIFHSQLNPEKTKVYFSSVRRQITGYGCAAFALRDAVAFLQNPHFFTQIESQELPLVEKNYQLNLHEIFTLPPAHMKGAQDYKQLQNYLMVYPTNPQKKQAVALLQQTLSKHLIKKPYGTHNHYITERITKYYLLTLEALKSLSTPHLKKIISESILTKTQTPWAPGLIPQNLSDAYRWHWLNI